MVSLPQYLGPGITPRSVDHPFSHPVDPRVLRICLVSMTISLSKSFHHCQSLEGCVFVYQIKPAHASPILYAPSPALTFSHPIPCRSLYITLPTFKFVELYQSQKRGGGLRLYTEVRLNWLCVNQPSPAHFELLRLSCDKPLYYFVLSYRSPSSNMFGFLNEF